MKTQRYIYFVVLAVVALSAILLSGCGTKEAERKLTVSIEPQRVLLQEIAGDKWRVESVLGSGADPENFDPPMSIFKSLMKSSAYFTIGHIPFEQSLIEKIKDGNADFAIVDSSLGIDLLQGTHGDHHDDEAVDPHVWCSVRNSRLIARNMYDGLVALDPENADYYKSNYARLDQRLDSIDGELSSILDDKTGRTFMMWHPSLSYFARDYNLNQLALGSENKELSVAGFKDKIRDAKAENVAVFVVQPEYDSQRSAAIADEACATLLRINLMGQDWIEEMIKVAKTIAQ